MARLPFVILQPVKGIVPRCNGYILFLIDLSIIPFVFVIVSLKHSANRSDNLPDTSAAILYLKSPLIFKAIILARLLAPSSLQLLLPSFALQIDPHSFP